MSLRENPAQEEAIRTIHGPLLIISCPGSGKTTTLVRRIHHMIEEGINPKNILMVTFSKPAALGMQAKYESVYGPNPGVMFLTIHALCYKILIYEKVVTKDSVLNDDEPIEYLTSLIRKKRFEGAYDIAKVAADGISMVKNNYLDPKKLNLPGIDKALFLEVYEAYEEWKKERGSIDYDDMLLMFLDLLKNNPGLCTKYQGVFRYIQCDEYQDTNFIQRDILYLLAGERKNLCVVGDDDQSIYAFRGAKPEIMLSFEKDFPNAHVIRMGTNYRCASSVVENSARLITHNHARFDKPFVSQRGEDGVMGRVTIRSCATSKEQMQYILREIERLHREGIPYKEMAVLFRTNLQAEMPVRILSDAKIPYCSTEKVKTMYESFIFQDLSRYVRLSAGLGEGRDFAIVLNHPNRYFKESEFRNAEYSLDGLMQAARYIKDTASSTEFWRWDKAKEYISDWMHSFGPGDVNLDSSPEDVFNRFISGLGYTRHIKEYSLARNLDQSEYLELLKDLKKDALTFSTVGEWFAYAEEYIRKVQEELKKKDQEGVVLSTMHKSKGLEWKAVFLFEADEKKCPHKKAILPAEVEEERRLFYVAMTRAKDYLYLLSNTDTTSRFIEETRSEAKKEEAKPKETFVIEPDQVPKYLPGKGVRHRKFGEGRVVRYQPGEIICRFGEEEKTFRFPETFCKGIMEYVT